MKILLNNNIEFVPSEKKFISIADILLFINFKTNIFDVRINFKKVTKANFNKPMIKENDIVEIIQFKIGG